MTVETIDTPLLIETAPQSLALLHLSVPAAAIRSVMGPGLEEVRAAIAAQGLSSTGPWFTHHLHRPAETFDFEICVPISAPLRPSGRVLPGHWPAMLVGRTVHKGGYERLRDAWTELDAWVRSQGRTPAADLYERYLLGPESTPDSAGWRTELSRPITAVA